MKDTANVALVSHHIHKCCSVPSTAPQVHCHKHLSRKYFSLLPIVSFALHTGHTLQAVRHRDTSCHSLCQVM